MKPAPRTIGNATVLCYSPIDHRHQPTDGCKHIVGGVVQGAYAGLAICQYEGSDGFSLLHCGPDWNEVTDTWHPTLEAAKEQAEFEYEGISLTWQRYD